ncbi:MAG: glutaminase [Marinifilaceae bacterium]
MDYRKILEEIEQEIAQSPEKGKVADYIPALGAVSPDNFGMAIKLVTGEEYSIGNAFDKFSIQSISKIISLTLSLKDDDSILNRRVGIEPSGNAFNSLVQLETENGIPRNPFINAGAIVVSDSLLSIYKNPKNRIIEFVRHLSGNPAIIYDFEVAASEKETGFRNLALANFIKSYGNLENNVKEVLDTYYHQCSLSMSSMDLARTFLFLANNGKTIEGEEILSFRQTKKVNSLLMTCGTYDAVGNFAYKVGIPAKSGVGGGIVGIIPGVMSVVVWAPGLDSAGNSYLGGKALEMFTTLTGRSVF